MAGLTGTNQVREIDFLQDDITGWTEDGGDITLSHQGTPIADTEANYERDFKCLQAIMGAAQGGSKITLPVASWGDASPALSTTPFSGVWIRASITGAIVKLIWSTDGVEVESTVTIVTANKWQFHEFSLSAATGSEDGFEIEILSASAFTLWVSRAQYFQDSRIMTAGTMNATYSDERVEIGSADFNAGASWVFERCLAIITSSWFLNPGAAFTHSIQSCLVIAATGSPLIRFLSSAGTLKITADGSPNLLTGVDRNWVLGVGVRIEQDASNAVAQSIDTLSAFDAVCVVRFAGVNTGPVENLDDISVYGSTFGVESVGVFACQIRCQNCKFVSTTVIAVLSRVDLILPAWGAGCTLSMGNAKGINEFQDGAAFPGSFTFVAAVDGDEVDYDGYKLLRDANFVVSPVTAGIVVTGVSGKTSSFDSSRRFADAVTDGAGLTGRMWCVAFQRWSSGTKDWTDGTDKYTFYFIDTVNDLVTILSFDMSVSQGSVASPTIVNLTTPPALGSVKLITEGS